MTRRRAFWLHFVETWHEGLLAAMSIVVDHGWRAAKLPSAAQCAVGFCRLVYEAAIVVASGWR